jgi:alpha-amylase
LLLSLVFHNHQPVGNFPEVFDAAYRQSYLPMLSALGRHTTIRVGLHYSGPVLDWLEGAHPEFFPLLQGLVDRGQVELLTGGYYEPILTIIPDRDKHGQIRKMTEFLLRRFGARAQGLWLAERVWEPHLPKPLAQAGVQYTILDDAHFIAAGLTEDQLTGHFLTEEEGKMLAIFPSLRRLRYLIPWQPVGDVMAYLRDRAGSGAALLLMGDDGEKFGLWPGTYAHCWEQGWVESFLSALEAQAWVQTVTPSDALQRPAAGRVYLPAASYDEMMEWSGGFWRQFLVKYPEINTMHKRMLRVSDKVWQMPDGSSRQRALDELWQGQCNCPYWHGVFGGIYLPHIRRATFGHLIAAEALADETDPVRQIAGDFDGDGAEEVEIANTEMVVLIDHDEGGGVVEWDWRPARINLTNVMARRREPYHEQLRVPPLTPTRSPEGSGHGVETIHTPRIRVKEGGLDQLLIYDRGRKASFLEHFLHVNASANGFWRGEEVSRPEVVGLVRINKEIGIEGPRLSARYRLENAGAESVASTLAVETNWAIFDPAATVLLDGRRYTVSDLHDVAAGTQVVLRDDGWPGPVTMKFSAARVWLMPVWTVSNSEAGFERIFQGLTCVTLWSIALEPRQSWETTLAVTLG